MQKSITYITLTLTALITNGCFGFDSGSDDITKNYEVLWIDLRANQYIAQRDDEYTTTSIGLTEPFIYAVGHNDNYIIAKQHPTTGFKGGFKIDTSVTNYYIIITDPKIPIEIDRVIGPINKNDFDSLRIKFKIEEIKFDQTYNRNP